jgi:thiol-disulfide isomerase/thioredoxin
MQLQYPVYYLEKSDFNNDGDLVNKKIPTDKPVFIMLQANWCPHCTNAKPAYQQFANRNEDKAFVCAIQVDGTRPGEQNIKSLIRNIYPDFQGYPSYIVYYKGEKIPFEEGRSLSHLENFLQRLI